MTGRDDIIEIIDLSKAYGGADALCGISLSVRRGEFLTLLGPSGCGKTTLLRCLAGFERPGAGTVLLDGRDVTRLPPNRRAVNTVFQNYALFPHMSVAQNVAFGLDLQRLPRAETARRVNEALDLVRLTGYGERRPAQLSGGQQQRVALARALVLRPLVLLLDEPLSALDLKLRKQMQLELKELQRELGLTFVFVTHDQEEALSMSDRVAVMRDGRIVQIGSPAEVYERPADLFVARFVGETNVLDAVVREAGPGRLVVDVEGVRRTVACGDSGCLFAPGERACIVLRPEDMRAATAADLAGDEELRAALGPEQSLRGRVVLTTYKGMTYDISVALPSGRSIRITRFFDEDDPSVHFRVGDEVAVSWVAGWEVVLPSDRARPGDLAEAGPAAGERSRDDDEDGEDGR